MEAAEYAAFQQAQGERVLTLDGTCWIRVRLGFYRPLLPFRELAPLGLRTPAAGLLGGCQFAVPAGSPSNSWLNLRLFENVAAYSLASLDGNRRRQVRLASERLKIRPVTDPRELAEQAFPVYCQFYERTHYAYRSDRRRRSGFARWVDGLFGSSGQMILGAYGGGQLGAVSVSQLVEDTLHYSTFFSTDPFLRLCASDLMLHTVREAAARQQGISRIFAGMYKSGVGLDRFYFLRGGRLARKPAWLKLGPVGAFLLRTCLPRQHARLCGLVPSQPAPRPGAPAPAGDHPTTDAPKA